MKALKTTLGIVIFLLIVYFVLTLVMPKIAFSRKKALTDSYKVTKVEKDTAESYIIRMDLKKGNWESLEYELNRIGWKPSEQAVYWTKSPNKTMFTEKEIAGFVKEYYRVEKKSVPIEEVYISEYLAVMKDDSGEYHLYYELEMGDSEIKPCAQK